MGADTMRDFCANQRDEKHRAHLDDTDLVRLHHHLPKLCSDQDLTLLGDWQNKHTKRATEKRKSEREEGRRIELSLLR